MLYISTSVWVLHTPNTGQNMLFHCFCAKRLKKFRKKWVIKFAPERWWSVLFPEKTMFSMLKTSFYMQEGVNKFSWLDNIINIGLSHPKAVLSSR